jgi:hypothetical protein
MKKKFIPETIQYQKHFNTGEHIPCPLCDRELIRESQIFSDSSIPALYCQTCIQFLPEGKLINHFRQSFFYQKNTNESLLSYTTMIIPPYRIQNYGERSSVGIISRYKTGKRRFYFKHLLTCPSIDPTSEEKIIDKIKMIELFR